jgi:hypothetical protein
VRGLGPAKAKTALLGRAPLWLVGELLRHRAPGETRLATVHEDDVRPDTVDRSYGREP